MDIIEHAAEDIQQGKLVAIPTETVYGLGANAKNEEACQRIFALKNRPGDNPLIVHVASIAQAEELAEFNEDARLLATLWPGPLTLVLPKRPNIELADSVTAGLDTIAIRIPAHEVALKLIKLSNTPIAAPSANKSGRLSPTTAEHVASQFNDGEFIILPNDYGGLSEIDGNKHGLESTIVDLSLETPTILRYGFITPELIESTLGKSVTYAGTDSIAKAPGMKHKHYSPDTDIAINVRAIKEDEVGLEFGSQTLLNPHHSHTVNLSASGNMVEAACNLFAMLHDLDDYAKANGAKRIVVVKIPLEGIGLAINDRLTRAAGTADS